MTLKTIRVGARGPAVKQWQLFLRGLDLYLATVDGIFGPKLDAATKAFQAREPNALSADGVVGAASYGKAMMLGFGGVKGDDAQANDPRGPEWPPVPVGAKSLTSTERAALLGKFRFIAAGSDSNPEGIKILDGWESQNLMSVDVPQLVGVSGAPKSGHVTFHKKGAAQLQKMFADWEQAGLIDRVLTWNGSYNPRFVRGSKSILSNHAWSSAIDLNSQWNGLGTRGALVGEKGCVRELVDIAYQNGFFWAGWWGYSGGRSDPMHLELCKIV